MRPFWKQLAYAAIAKLIVADRERTLDLIDESIANTDHPEVKLTLKQLKAAILGAQK